MARRARNGQARLVPAGRGSARFGMAWHCRNGYVTATADDANPHGITRPANVGLLMADELGEACADERATIRAQVAAAKDRAACWEPGAVPAGGTTPRRASTAPRRLPSSRGGRRS